MKGFRSNFNDVRNPKLLINTHFIFPYVCYNIFNIYPELISSFDSFMEIGLSNAFYWHK